MDMRDEWLHDLGVWAARNDNVYELWSPRQPLMAVEMEAAALYVFAQVRQKAVVCFAQ
jgi:purine-nucleoside phosphorylase